MHVVLCVSVSFILLLQSPSLLQCSFISVYVTCIVYGHIFIYVPLLHLYCKDKTKWTKYLVVLFDFMEYHFQYSPEIKKRHFHIVQV